jgi:hypothetical protein
VVAFLALFVSVWVGGVLRDFLFDEVPAPFIWLMFLSIAIRTA